MQQAAQTFAPSADPRSMFRKLNHEALARPEHVLFCRVHNESYLLPHFLAHYRRLGIEHFYFADDLSDDGTRELLLAEPDCTVIEASFRYQDRVGETPGKNFALAQIPRLLIGEGWVLVVDADEFLILPQPYQTIAELLADLDTRGVDSCIGTLVDFYPGTLRQRFADPSINPFEAYPFFDFGPYFLWRQGAMHPLLLHAGVRHRLNEWMFERDRQQAWKGYRPTMLQKVPLIRVGGEIELVNPHTANKPPYVGTQLALAHFKFTPDLDAKIAHAVRTGGYFANSFYYRQLEKYVPIFEDRPLFSLVSRRYNEPADVQKAYLTFANGRPF